MVEASKIEGENLKSTGDPQKLKKVKERKARFATIAPMSEKDKDEYVKAVCRAILNRQWENVNLDLHQHSWETITKEWISHMELGEKNVI